MTNNINSVIIEGVLENKQKKKTDKGTEYTVLLVTCKHCFKGKDGELEQEWHTFVCQAWGKLGEAAKAYKVGEPCRIVGRMANTRTEDELIPYTSVIIAEHIEGRA